MSNVWCIYASYQESNLRPGIEVIQKIVEDRWQKRFNCLAVENSWPKLSRYQSREGWTFIDSDNRLREFSAYDDGFSYLLKNETIGSKDLVIFANDTFNTHYGSDYLNLFDKNFVESSTKDSSLVGWVDQYPEKIEILGCKQQSWIRTSFVVGRASDFANIFPLSEFVLSLKVFADNEKDFFNPEDKFLSENFKAFNRTWFFGDPNPVFKERWHSAETVKDKSPEFLRQKMQCILAEQVLSLRAKNIGLKLADVNTHRMFLV